MTAIVGCGVASESVWVGSSESSGMAIVDTSGKTHTILNPSVTGAVTAAARAGRVVWTGHRDGVCVEWCCKVQAAIRVLQVGQGDVNALVISEHFFSGVPMMWSCCSDPGMPELEYAPQLVVHATTPDDRETQTEIQGKPPNSRCSCVTM